jgi:D-alanyl-D-alanine carboxypeptidase
MTAWIFLAALLQAPAPVPLQAKFQAKLEELHGAGQFPGMTAAYVLPDGAAGEFAIGMADVEAKEKMRPGHRMFAGSIGKTFVAAVALQLVQENKLDLDAPLSRYLGGKPYFGRIPNAKLLTVRHLMNHTSGIREHVLNPDFLNAVKDSPDKAFTPDELASYALDSTPLFEPGKGWAYADTNYIFVGLVIEQILGRPLYAEASARLLGPLGLGRTQPQEGRKFQNLATGYSMPNSPFGFSGRVQDEQGAYPFNPQMEWCGGGFVSNALDLAKWAKAMFEGKAYSASLLPQVLAGQKASTGPNEKYGLGVQLRPTEWGESYGHSGWFPGYLSDMAYFPHKGFAVAVQFNTDHGAKIRKRTYAVVLELAKVVDAELAKNQASLAGPRDFRRSTIRASYPISAG